MAYQRPAEPNSLVKQGSGGFLLLAVNRVPNSDEFCDFPLLRTSGLGQPSSVSCLRKWKRQESSSQLPCPLSHPPLPLGAALIKQCSSLLAGPLHDTKQEPLMLLQTCATFPLVSFYLVPFPPQMLILKALLDKLPSTQISVSQSVSWETPPTTLLILLFK